MNGAICLILTLSFGSFSLAESAKIPTKENIAYKLNRNVERYSLKTTPEEIERMADYYEGKLIREVQICKELQDLYPKSKVESCAKIISDNTNFANFLGRQKEFNDLVDTQSVHSSLRHFGSADYAAWLHGREAILERGIGGASLDATDDSKIQSFDVSRALAALCLSQSDREDLTVAQEKLSEVRVESTTQQ